MTDVAEYVVFSVYESNRQGSEVARIQASTYKWGPGNAIERFVADQSPPAGDYLVSGPVSNKIVWTRYTVAYPAYVIVGTRSGGPQLYGEREMPTWQ